MHLHHGNQLKIYKLESENVKLMGHILFINTRIELLILIHAIT